MMHSKVNEVLQNYSHDWFLLALMLKIRHTSKTSTNHVLEIQSYSTADVGCVNLTIFCSDGVHSQCYQISFLNVFR